jgi:3-oxoacyl-[acyl-carrier protein] reductase
MDLGIKGKVAVITASSRGLGKAVAEVLAKEGVSLAICSRDEIKLLETADYLKEKYKVEVKPLVCDVSDPAAVKEFREEVLAHFKACHILFTNSGGPPAGTVTDYKVSDYKEALELNLLSTISLVEEFLPVMKEQKWGRIIALTSITVKQPLSNLALSNVSRVGVVAFIKSLATQVADLNITANSVAPGYFLTERVNQLITAQAEKNQSTFQQGLNQLTSTIPARKLGNPLDFGSLVAYLASEQASYITGDTILIDGGMYPGLM